MGFNGLVTVRGRKSGDATDHAGGDHRGRRQALGLGAWGEVNWVRNLRAAGRTIEVRRQTEDVTATELDPRPRLEFFRDVLGPLARRSRAGCGSSGRRRRGIRGSAGLRGSTLIDGPGPDRHADRSCRTALRVRPRSLAPPRWRHADRGRRKRPSTVAVAVAERIGDVLQTEPPDRRPARYAFVVGAHGWPARFMTSAGRPAESLRADRSPRRKRHRSRDQRARLDGPGSGGRKKVRRWPRCPSARPSGVPRGVRPTTRRGLLRAASGDAHPMSPPPATSVTGTRSRPGPGGRATLRAPVATSDPRPFLPDRRSGCPFVG